MAHATLTKASLCELYARIKELFLEDDIPWVVGYSGGKDSTAALQLVWYALLELPRQQRLRKAVHVISTDTLVEQPVVAQWVTRSLQLMREVADAQNMPIRPHRLTPRISDSYWVNLIGRGYPAPRQTFRWCTSRLKIEPSNRFILDVVRTHGETILVLGTRKSESARRAANMKRYERQRRRHWLSPNASLANSWVFTPIEDWSNDDVWLYLMQYENPWGHSNKDLLTMYRGASADNECPLVLDQTTPSCGNSRFGCWVCTLVSSDKSMEAMIQNDSEKIWMAPLLDFRNEIGELDQHGRINDRERRDFRRMDGSIKLNPRDGRTIHGPYLKEWREHLLRRLLEVQKEVSSTVPLEVGNLKLISDDELREIRRIWVLEKHEFDDALPLIYQQVTGVDWPYVHDLEPGFFGKKEWELLKKLCNGNPIYLELQASLLDIEQRAARAEISRRGLSQELERLIRRCYYESEDDAIAFVSKCQELRNQLTQTAIWHDEGFSEEGPEDE